MGKNALDGVQREEISFNSPKACRNYLCGLCPHDLFTNTKMDLGPCTKVHSDKLKEDYEQALAEGKADYEMEFFRNLEGFVHDCDRKIRTFEKRLQNTAEDAKTFGIMKEIADLELEIQKLTVEIEKLGEEGKVDESIAILSQVEEIKSKKNEKEELLRTMTAHDLTQQQKLRVCDICSAYLSITDSDRRLADHFSGKMHLGYLKIRELVAELREKLKDKAPPQSSAHHQPHGGYGGGYGLDQGFPGGGYDQGYGGRGGWRGGRGGGWRGGRGLYFFV
ncbi:hypothetical protein BKA69DRAFT_1028204 [Paraphysoderma sedebokerense]|nr:hypothetical protein BKA69DRAFT_1028204 [Paraphysoderma sedebokerense]